MKNRRMMISITAGMLLLLLLTIVLIMRSCVGKKVQFVEVDASQPDIDVQLLDVNPYSRPGIESEGVRGVVIHYTANPEVRRRIIEIILTDFNTHRKQRQAAILLSD